MYPFVVFAVMTENVIALAELASERPTAHSLYDARKCWHIRQCLIPPRQRQHFKRPARLLMHVIRANPAGFRLHRCRQH